jgi:hypothetical protein
MYGTSSNFVSTTACGRSGPIAFSFPARAPGIELELAKRRTAAGDVDIIAGIVEAAEDAAIIAATIRAAHQTLIDKSAPSMGLQVFTPINRR